MRQTDSNALRQISALFDDRLQPDDVFAGVRQCDCLPRRKEAGRCRRRPGSGRACQCDFRRRCADSIRARRSSLVPSQAAWTRASMTSRSSSRSWRAGGVEAGCSSSPAPLGLDVGALPKPGRFVHGIAMAEKDQRHRHVEHVPFQVAVAVDVVEVDRIAGDDDQVLNLGGGPPAQGPQEAPGRLHSGRHGQELMLAGPIGFFVEVGIDGLLFARIGLVEAADAVIHVMRSCNAVSPRTTRPE